MAEFSEARDMTEQVAAAATARVTKANQNTLNFLFGANRLLLDEFVFAGNEFWSAGEPRRICSPNSSRRWQACIP